MKIIILITLLISTLTYSQEKIISQVGGFRLKNSGVIKTDENISGYFNFYKVDKLKKGQVEYAINIIDENLNDIATKSFICDKNTSLKESSYNNQSLIFQLFNEKENFFRLVTFDNKANLKDDIKIEIAKKDLKWIKYAAASGYKNSLLSVENKGFVFNYYKSAKKLSYQLKYIPTNGGKSWTYTPDSDQLLDINPIQSNDKVIVAIEASRPSMMSKKITNRVLFIDVDSGKLLFAKNYEQGENPRSIANAYLNESNEVIMIGEYFKKGAKIVKDESLGIFAESTSLDGTVKFDTKINWDDELFPALKAAYGDEKIAERCHILFHDFIKTKDGNYYAIGELYKKSIDGAALAVGVLSRSGGPTSKIVITDAIIIKLDPTFKLLDVKVFEKGKSTSPAFSILSPQLNALWAKSLGNFDYVFTQRDSQKDRFYTGFVDYERLKGEKNKFAFKSINYSDGELSEDKVYLKNSRRESSRVYAGKTGHVLINEYNRKEKTITLHLEKININ